MNPFIESVLPEKLEKLRNLEAHLNEAILGQEQVISRVVPVLQAGELGLAKPERPKGSFLFLGPTGVGKTQLAIEFTRYLFGEDRLIRFDMSEYQTQESLGLLLGSRLGETGIIGQRLDEIGAGTLLFDEMEKAHTRILDVFLQLLDAARLTMASGQTFSFSNFYVVFTSNIGGAELVAVQHSSPSAIERYILALAQRSLRPELFARIDEKLVFAPLDYQTQKRIIQKMVDAEVQALGAQGIHVKLGDEAIRRIWRDVSRSAGARGARNLIQRAIRAEVISRL